jgi:hypothetical protein
MEMYSSSVEDQLIDGLSFKLAPGSSYVTERRSVTYYPQGSNIYSTGGTKLLRILVNGDGWLDPTTLKVGFEVVNKDGAGGAALRVLGGPHTFFRRARLLASNTIIEDIDYYNRIHQQFDTLRAGHVRENEDAEGFETRFDQPQWQPIFNNNSVVDTYVTPQGPVMGGFATSYISVLAGKSKMVYFKPLFGLLNAGKLIPLQYCPLVLELELVTHDNDVIISNNDVACKINIGVDDTSLTPVHAADVNGGTKNTSTTWAIQNPTIKCDVCTLDNSLQNEYAQLLLSGKSLPINYSSFISQYQTISSTSPSVTITRALSRLKTVFVTFDQTLNAEKLHYDDVHIQLWKKPWNDFFHNMSYSPFYYDANYEMEYQLLVGSKLIEEFPYRSIAECFKGLRKAMGIHSSNFHSMDITPYDYRNHKFILAFDCERVAGSNFTGLNIKNGSQISVRMKPVGSSVATVNQPDQVYITLHYDSILSIKDSGIEVFE